MDNGGITDLVNSSMVYYAFSIDYDTHGFVYCSSNFIKKYITCIFPKFLFRVNDEQRDAFIVKLLCQL